MVRNIGLVLTVVCWTSFDAVAVDLPQNTLAALKSEEFREREDAQVEILAWARKQGEPASDELFRLSQKSDDPEIRERCLGVLRDLVNDEYLSEGDGYIGILMRNELGMVPEDAKPRAIIRITEIVPNSAADIAKLKINDLIVGLGDQIWRDELASEPFGAAIRKLLRDGELLDIDVVLGRRPVMDVNPFLNQRAEVLEAVENAAKEAYFQNWLQRKKSAK